MRMLLALFGVVAAIIASAIMFSVQVAPAVSVPGSVVKLTFTKETPHGVIASHCSGAHLGGGVILTAEHCVGHSAIVVVDDHGGESASDVLWASKEYDIALVLANHLPIAKANISCVSPPIGSEITVSGNPLNLEWIVTSGKVLSSVHTNARWKRIVAVDITVAGGNSGGPVLDSKGDVVGVIVGMYESAQRIGLFVPGSAICMLLGRA
jgi:serine protease Do